MSVNLFAFNHEDDICKLRIIDDFPHIQDETVDSFIIDFILLQFADVEDTDVIEPLASIKASENKELFGSNNTSGMSLSSCWCLFALNWMTPAHRLSIEYIEVIRWNNLLE